MSTSRSSPAERGPRPCACRASAANCSEGMRFAGSPSFEVWLATERRHLQAERRGDPARGRTGPPGRRRRERSGRSGRPAGAPESAGRELPGAARTQPRGGRRRRRRGAPGRRLQRAVQARARRQPGATLEAAMRTATAAPTARPATGRAAALAQLEAGEAAIGAGALDAGLQCLRRAIVEADATGDATLRARARVALGGALVHAARGRDEEGATALHEALNCRPGRRTAARSGGLPRARVRRVSARPLRACAGLAAAGGGAGRRRPRGAGTHRHGPRHRR